jgi:hypothetical protein
MLPRARFKEHGPRHHPHSKNLHGERSVVPNPSKSAKGEAAKVVLALAAIQPVACNYKTNYN